MGGKIILKCEYLKCNKRGIRYKKEKNWSKVRGKNGGSSGGHLEDFLENETLPLKILIKVDPEDKKNELSKNKTIR